MASSCSQINSRLRLWYCIQKYLKRTMTKSSTELNTEHKYTKSNVAKENELSATLHDIYKKLTRIAHGHSEGLSAARNIFSIWSARSSRATADWAALLGRCCGGCGNRLLRATWAGPGPTRAATTSMILTMCAHQVSFTCWAATWFQQVLLLQAVTLRAVAAPSF